MKQVRKHILNHLPIVFLGSCLLLLAIFTLRFQEARLHALRVQIQSDSGSQQVSVWKNPDGIYYLFLPSYCGLTDARFLLDTSAPITLDGQSIQSGQTLENVTLGHTYTLKVGTRSYPFRVLRSANVATLYISTDSGTMKAIHADKNNTESISVSLITADGQLNYAGQGEMRGRGNSTWLHEKRPYTITFPQAENLLNMGSACKWVLLSNPTDETNMRNKLVFDLAQRIGLYWSPECHYVDLYLNGEYRGLYLIAERIEIGENRLDIGSDPNSFLGKLDLNERLVGMRNPYVTNAGRAVEITTASEPVQHLQTIHQSVQQMEDAILSGQIQGILDIDSWAYRLLFDEITENIDSDRASSYFYYYNGIFYGGPIWDYDQIWGSRDRSLNPEALLAGSLYRSSSKNTPYQYALYHHPDFYTRVVELYQTEFLPHLQQMADTGILELGEQIAQASRMNSVRWRHMYDEWNWDPVTPAYFSEFLQKRIDFLNSLWLEGEEYCMVQVETSQDLNYLNFVVRPGETFTQLDSIIVPGVSDPVWINSETGAVFDDTQPITDHIRLDLLQNVSALNSSQGSYLVLAYTCILIAITSLCIWLEYRGRKPKRRSRT